METLPKPQSISDKYYDFLCNPTEDKRSKLPTPREGHRTEQYLYHLCLNGGVGSRNPISIDATKVVDTIPEDVKKGEIYAIRKEARS